MNAGGLDAVTLIWIVETFTDEHRTAIDWLNHIVLLAGSDLAGWVAIDANFRFLTSAIKVQLEMGSDISREVADLKDFAQTISRSYNRDKDWIGYHAETLAELVDEEEPDETRFAQAAILRVA